MSELAYASEDFSHHKKNITLTPKIVGGIEAEKDAWPWIVALISENSDPYWGQFCGGSLIHPKWVLTAAHCVQVGREIYSPSKIDIAVGIHDLSSPENWQRIRSKRVIPHPAYNSSSNDKDIALIELETELNSNPIVSLASGTHTYENSQGTVIGWGRISEDGNSSPILLQVSLPIISNELCNQSSMTKNMITSDMMCAGYAKGGKDSCKGDSGGPLVIFENNQWILVGVVSWGIGCARPDNYGVYARITTLRNFIDTYVPQLNCPMVETQDATTIESNSAVLHASIYPQGEQTTYFFEYGMTLRYDYQTPINIVNPVNSVIPVQASILNLDKNTLYHYRIVGENSHGQAYGSDKTFFTTGDYRLPKVITGAVSDITYGSAVLNGTINPVGLNTRYYFDYGKSETLDLKTPEKYAGNSIQEVQVKTTMLMLEHSTLYSYRIVAINPNGISKGLIRSFQTSSLNVKFLADGSFEEGNIENHWTDESAIWETGSIYKDSDMAHSGAWLAWFSSDQEREEIALLSQTITLPKDTAPKLSFWLMILRGYNNDNMKFDKNRYLSSVSYLKIVIDTTEIYSISWNQTDKLYDWHEIKLDISSFADGNNHVLSFQSYFPELDSSGYLIDDIQLIDIRDQPIINNRLDINEDKIVDLKDIIVFLQCFTQTRPIK